ncbi:MAG: RsmD family RNA methyltransferase [Alphaproteobacteria bacterium]|nr:RsmD family RNA methyltransferase [Alphaproteobacteria bacterium]
MKSNLQIISGKYRGKKLFLPNDARPTQNLARGALFNMLNEILNVSQPFAVWDAFAGSGAFGLECTSRYDNANVVFTDLNVDTIKKNLGSINATATIEKSDALSVIKTYGATSDLIFLDPPYSDFGLGLLFVKKLSKIAKSGAVIIWEYESSQEKPKIDDNWDVLKDKTYGRARFLLLRKK